VRPPSSVKRGYAGINLYRWRCWLYWRGKLLWVCNHYGHQTTDEAGRCLYRRHRERFLVVETWHAIRKAQEIVQVD